MSKKFEHPRWERGRSLGEGGQGQTFEATDRAGEHGVVAMKFLKNKSRGGRFAREIAALKKLNHPNVVKLLDHSAPDAEENLFIVMPLAAGGDLAHRPGLYKGAPEATLTVATQLADALAHAHENGIVHRDVKPANILFANPTDHACLLADFGICYTDDGANLTGSQDWMGPRAYIAKELEGGAEPTPAADIYSLGKVIYFMLSGGVDLPREEHRTPRYDVFGDGSAKTRALGALLDRMICPLEKRIQSMAEVRARLAHVRDMDLESVAAPLQPELLQKIVRAMDEDALRKRNADDASAAIAERRREVEDVIAELKPFVTSALTNLVKLIPPTDAHKITLVPNAAGSLYSQSQALGGMGMHGTFYIHTAVGLLLERNAGVGATSGHALRLVLCRVEQPSISIGTTTSSAAREPTSTVALVPLYMPDSDPNRHGYLNRGETNLSVSRNFKAGVHMRLDLQPADWPAREQEVRQLVADAFGRFMVLSLADRPVLVLP